MANRLISISITLAFLVCVSTTASAQTTSFTYQGRLADSGTPVNANYDLQFALWNSLSAGAQIGSTQTINSVAVSNGVFIVNLDFGASAFPGTNRFLEIAVRPAGVGSFTTLAPRQPITSTPYAVRSLNAATADSVPNTGLSPGSGNYIQNTVATQAATNFNISGNGTAGGTLSGNVVSSATEYDLNGSRILSSPGINNLFVGAEVGTANSTGASNTFVGKRAGAGNTTGGFNAIFGSFAGEANTEGQGNSFFGSNAGRSNITGDINCFFGLGAGQANTDGRQNNFFGYNTGAKNTTGLGNSFYGTAVGGNNLSGKFNSFFGDSAGTSNIAGENNVYLGASSGFSATGSSNTFVGTSADFAITPDRSTSGNRNTLLGAGAALGSGAIFSPNNATAIGANARVDQSNSLVLGSIKGVNFATADTNVGIGTTEPTARLSIVATGDGARLLYLGTERAWVFRQLGTGAASALELTADDPTNNNKNFLINTQGFVGIGTTAPTANLSVNGSANKPGGGSWGTFSDERLKTIRGSFTAGLDALMRLQPLRYEYKPDNSLQLKSDGEHIGFSAQAVQKVIPEAVTSTEQGYLVVNNDPILWTMLNAIKEQQAQIDTLRARNASLNARLRKMERRNQVASRQHR
jgi:hypothetical protein